MRSPTFQSCGWIVLPPSNVQVQDAQSCQRQVAGGGLLTGLFTHESELTVAALNSEGERFSGVMNQFGISFFFRKPRVAGSRERCFWSDRRYPVQRRRQAVEDSCLEEFRHQPAYEGNAEKDADYFPHEVTSVSTVFRAIAEVVVEEKL